MKTDGARVHYAHRRIDGDGPPAAFAAGYEPAGPAAPAQRGSFEEWATERYCLYTLDERGEVLRGDIHHPPWPLRPARAAIGANSMGRQIGIELPGDPVLHFARRQDVVFWLLEHA